MRGVTWWFIVDTNNAMPFQLTRLMRGVTLPTALLLSGSLFQLTRLMRGVTTASWLVINLMNISTHTPHARRDVFNEYIYILFRISTHTPHARRDRRTSINFKWC